MVYKNENIPAWSLTLHRAPATLPKHRTLPNLKIFFYHISDYMGQSCLPERISKNPLYSIIDSFGLSFWVENKRKCVECSVCVCFYLNVKNTLKIKIVNSVLFLLFYRIFAKK